MSNISLPLPGGAKESFVLAEVSWLDLTGEGLNAMENDTKFSYFLLGLGAGAALGILFAPKQGVEARDYLQSKAREGADYLARQGEELRDRLNETIENANQNLQAPVNTLFEAVEVGKRAYQQTVGKT